MRQTYLALSVLLSTAAQLGVDADLMEKFISSRYDEALALRKQELSAVVIAGVGYRALDDAYPHAKKIRKPVLRLFIHR